MSSINDSEVAKLLQEQDEIGDKLERLLINFGKDSADRKTEKYIADRLELSAEYWSVIQANHKKLAPLNEKLSDRPYFKNKYYESLEKVYFKLTSILLMHRLNNEREQGGPVATTSGRGATTASFTKNNQQEDDENRDDEENDATNDGLTNEQKLKGIKSSVATNTQKDEDATRLVRRQKALMRLITHQIQNIESKASQMHSRPYFEMKINTLKEYHREIVRNDQQIWEVCTEEELWGYEPDIFYELDCWIQDTIISLQQGLATIIDSAPADQSSHPKPHENSIKLPKITLPTFDGNYLRWTQFHDLYIQLIHNQAITNTQKMFYLTTNLSGEAKALIQHLPISSENYDDAWNILNNRYNNKRLLVTALLNKLLSQPTIQTESAASIKNLHDITNECLLGLKNLGLSIDSWDPLVVHIIIKKLDKNTHILYEQSLEAPRDLNSIQNMLSFLETRFQSLEALGGRTLGNTRNTPKFNHHPRSSFMATSIKGDCVVCKQGHPLHSCKQFLSLNPSNRLELLRKHNLCVNCMKAGHSSRACFLRGCRRCSARHHTLVHLERMDKNSPVNQTNEDVPNKASDIIRPHQSMNPHRPQNLAVNAPSPRPTILAAQVTKSTRGYVLLSTALVKLRNPEGVEVECRAVLDSGSQLNFITDHLAKKLSLQETLDPLNIQGIGKGAQCAHKRVNVELLSRTHNFSIRMEAHILSQITTYQPTQSLDITHWPIPENITLADPGFHHPGKIDLLIGAENFFQLLAAGQINLGDALPSLQNTALGWIVGGKTLSAPSAHIICGICSEADANLNEQVEKFWKQEEPDATKPTLSATEIKCEGHFNQNVRRDEAGRFIVRLPFAREPSNLGESKDVALNRFYTLERKLTRNPDIKAQYVDFIKEYENLGHMEEINFETISSPYYFLPHHCVMKPDSTTTQLRVVFDASMKTSSNVSLNDLLYTGPTIQDELFSILLRFRLPRFVFTADIEKMYRQVLLHDEDRKYQLILWRDDPSRRLKCYQLSTVTYGIRAAPYLATKCLQRLANQAAQQHPLGATTLMQDFYVDDVMTGCNSLSEAIETQEQLIQILQSGGFKLRKWCANHAALLRNISPEDRAPQLDLHDDDDCHVKTLGITWLPRSDEFSIKTQWTEETTITKRSVLSDIAHLFDPLGFMTPVIVKAKLFLQELWSLHFAWDDNLPDEHCSRWINFRRNLTTLNNIKIERHAMSGKIPKSMQLHAFSDASEQALGAAIYIRAVLENGQIIARLLCAKSKVAPKKNVTIPRLELCAAKLAANLMHRIRRDLKWNHPCYYWTDSEIVLAWLNTPSSSHYTFVANRIASIQEVSTAEQWFHVPSKHNPADLASRGTTPESLKDCSLWWHGPLFLHAHENTWPERPSNLSTDLERRQPKITLSASTNSISIVADIDHRNSFNHLQRIMAYVLRFVRNIGQQPSKRKRDELNVDELDEALMIIVRETQQGSFTEDLVNLQKGKYVNANSNLSSLSPFLDERGIIRVGGRLEESNLSYDAKHPILLPYGHHITKLVMTDIHNNNSHVGPQALLAITRQRFWPIKGKTIARSIVQNCVRCRKFRPRLMKQLMGNLPAERIQPSRPFLNVGIDFCGPFWIHFKLRGRRPQKCYVAIFCCFATKAVHIEVVSDLSTNAFLGALKRFVSRRGCCRNIYCDNATNFVGASNQIKDIQQAVYSKNSVEKITHFCTSRGIDFHFIPPRTPHFGGLWEAAVKSAKHLFQRSVAAASLTYEELETTMTEIEAILNSRPLTPMSSNPDDLCALTPGHFLIGEPLTSTVDPHAHSSKSSLLKNWKQVSELKQQFWQRWAKEYLCELQHRTKWKQHCENAQPGTMVIIKDDNLPPLSWPLGRIVNTIKGDDGLVRVADVRTASGLLRRPIHKLAPLPTNENQELMDLYEGLNSTTRQVEPSDPQPSRNNKREENKPLSPNATVGKKRRFSPVSLFLMICLIIPTFADKPIHLNPFQTPPGLYFESMGSTHLVTNEWNLVIYYEMRSYWQELQNIKGGIETLTRICNSTRDVQSCSQSITQFSNIVTELENNNQLLVHESHPRRKRAPLDIIGNLAHSLFGVLDSTYAEKMSQIINDVQGNQQHLQELLRNQTSIIDSTVNIIKQSNEVVEGRLQEFEDYINKTISEIKGITKEVQNQRMLETFNSLSTRLILSITNYQRMQSMLLDVIIDTHHGKVNPALLAPNQLRSQLIIIKDHLPTTLRLPANQNNLLELYSLMTVEVRVATRQIIFRVRLPLFSYEPFELLRIVPVPISTNDSFLIIEPSSEFLIINLHRDQYYPLSGQEMAMCSTIGNSNHMCRQHHPLYRKGSHISACELGFLTNAPSLPTCKISIRDQISRWIQLVNPNHWIYVTQKETTINIVCGTMVTPAALVGSGILNISTGCVIKDETTTIQAHNLYPSTMRTSFISTKNLTELLRPFEVTDLSYHPNKHQNISAEFRELKGKIQQLHAAEDSFTAIHHHDVHQYTIGYAGLLITLILCTYLVWKYFADRRPPTRPLPPIPLTRTRSARPPFRLRRETEEIVEPTVQRGGGC